VRNPIFKQFKLNVKEVFIMFKRRNLTNLLILVIVMLLSAPYFAFSQEKAEEQTEMENFSNMILRINLMVARFGEKLKMTKINDVTKVNQPWGGITLEEFNKFGVSSAGGTTIYLQKNNTPAAWGSAHATAYFIPEIIKDSILPFIQNELKTFCDEIYPILKDACKKFRSSPVRLNSVNIEIAPFGIGGSLVIGINYDSPVFIKETGK
jgi:hypothetical protein